jgi:DNA-binding transcriptional ArsR family regulator
MEELIKMQADLIKTFSSPHRLEIVKLLCDRELNASTLIEKTKISKANLSQHMAILTSSGIVTARREGTSVYYSLTDERISEACSIIGKVAMDNIRKKNDIIKRAF